MITLNESTATKRRIPFYLVDSTTGLVGQTGKTFSGAEIQLSKNGAAFANFLGTVTEVSAGVYYYECTSAEVGTVGFLAVKVNKASCKVILQTEIIVGAGFYSSFRLPLYLTDSATGATGQTGLTFSGSEIQISENGAAFANFAGATTEVGSGFYYYTPASTEFDGVGYVVLKLIKTGVRTYVISHDLEQGFTFDVTNPTATLISLPTTEESAAVVNVYDNSGLNFVQLTVQDYTDRQKMVVYETGQGFFHPFNGLSTVTGVGTAIDPYVYSIYRRGRWPTGITITFKVKVVDASGNLVELTA